MGFENSEKDVYELLKYFEASGKTLSDYKNKKGGKWDKNLFDRLLRRELIGIMGVEYIPLEHGKNYTFNTNRYDDHIIFTTEKGYWLISNYEQKKINKNMLQISDKIRVYTILMLIFTIISLILIAIQILKNFNF